VNDKKFSPENLSDFHLDALQEVGNVGAGQAAIALTQFLNRSTYMSVPKVGLDNLNAIHALVKMPSDEEIAIISLDTVTGLQYSLLVFFNKKSVSEIIDLMTTTSSESNSDLPTLSPLFKSLIKETGSILLLKYVEALNYFLKANSFPSPPTLRIGTLGSLAENELSNLSGDISTVLVIECDIFTTERNIAVDLAIVPRLDTFELFMKSLFTEED